MFSPSVPISHSPPLLSPPPALIYPIKASLQYHISQKPQNDSQVARERPLLPSTENCIWRIYTSMALERCILIDVYVNGTQRVKFAYDSVIVSLLNGHDSTHGPVVKDFSEWCESSFLKINVLKTKELIIDFRKKPPPSLLFAGLGPSL